jgi:protein-S-isoprenylcysteine O-methyltransferase Ste14
VNTQPATTFLAWAGAALFAGALSYFLFTYAVTFGEITTGAVAASAVAVDVGLFTLFALHHSVFARERVRAWMSRAFSPRVERSVYVWAASLMLIGVCALWQPIPGVAWQVEGPARWLFPAVQLAGVWLTLRSAAIIDIWDLAGVRQASGGPEGPPLHDSGGPEGPPVHDSGGPEGPPRHDSGAANLDDRRGGPSGPPEFKTDGPYGWVRHPIYLGWLLLVFPMATMTMTRLLFAVISSAYIVVAIPFEERSLRRASGGTYENYMKAVRWKLIPGLY